MRHLEIIQFIRREFKAVLRLVPWLSAAVLLAIALWQFGQVATAELGQSAAGLFQSPPLNPTETTAPPSPTATVTETVPAEPTLPSFTDTPAPTETPVPAPSETATPVVEPTASPTVTPTGTPTASPTATPVESGATSDDRYSEGDSNLRFEWGMLFDSVALGMTYIWLCCGVLVVLGIPVGFAVLWVLSKRYQQPEGASPAEPDQEEASEE
jgi:hypothetical protein